MKKINILTIGRNAEIGSVVLRLINNNPEWQGFLALTDEDAKDIFEKESIDVVLLGSGIEEANEVDLRNHFSKTKPKVIILQHYGGGSGLLKNEIKAALDLKYN